MISDTTKAMLDCAPAQWRDLVERWQKGTGPGTGSFPPVSERASMHEVIIQLDSLIQHAARLRGYLDQRYGYGGGDQGHERAVKKSNRVVARVRKALGSYPQQDLNF
jgi:hypothetical protein